MGRLLFAANHERNQWVCQIPGITPIFGTTGPEALT
jgi:hypothetical protein